jgi:hypothetical protein
MNQHRILFGVGFTLAALGLSACGGSTELPPTAPPVAEAPSAAPAAVAPVATTPPEVTPEPVAEAPAPPKPAKERIVGQWQFDFTGEARAKAEEAAHKKAGKADKDNKKFDAAMKALEAEAATEWIEFTADSTYVSYVGEKPVVKVKYEIAKEEGDTVTMKPTGKDEISKKELKVEIPVTLKGDTLEMKDPKKGVLVFKRKS